MLNYHLRFQQQHNNKKKISKYVKMVPTTTTTEIFWAQDYTCTQQANSREKEREQTQYVLCNNVY